MSVKILTDSASDLTKEVAEEYGVEIMPMLVYVNGKEYLDGITLTTEEFYQEMVNGAEVKTAQIPLTYFIERFEKMAETEDEYLYIAFSSNLSGTYQAAVLARQTVLEDHPNLKLEIIDTKCASLGLGLIAVETAKRASEGQDLQSLIAYANEQMQYMEHLFTVDDLEYLFRGGRVSRSQAMLGNILNIKPILNVQDGFLIPIDKVKGKKKRLQKMFAYIDEHGNDFDKQTVGICHTMNEGDVAAVRAHFQEKGTQNFIINQLGCTVGAHCGPGMITIFFKSKIVD